MHIKVVGTTFRPLPNGAHLSVERTWTDKEIPCAAATALLIPEPDNPYDAGAIKVVMKLMDGSAFHIGYIGKDDPIKATLLKRFETQQMMIAHVNIRDYGQVGQLNPSFSIAHIEGITDVTISESNQANYHRELLSK